MDHHLHKVKKNVLSNPKWSHLSGISLILSNYFLAFLNSEIPPLFPRDGVEVVTGIFIRVTSSLIARRGERPNCCLQLLLTFTAAASAAVYSVLKRCR